MILEIPEGDFDAYIFDCDGTLAHSMPLHYKAWTRALAAHSCDFPEDLFYKLGGVPTQKIVELLNEMKGLQMPPFETAAHKETLFVSLIPEVKPIEPVVSFVHDYHGKKPLAVASGGHRSIIIQILESLGILDRFSAIVGAEDYQNGKPAPDPFLEAARRIGVDPSRCLAFEDTEIGRTAALAAGMQCVLVPSR